MINAALFTQSSPWSGDPVLHYLLTVTTHGLLRVSGKCCRSIQCTPTGLGPSADRAPDRR